MDSKKREYSYESHESSKKMKMDPKYLKNMNVMGERKAFIVDFETNLPPNDIFDLQNGGIEIENRGPHSKVLSTKYINENCSIDFTGKQTVTPTKHYIGLFNKSTHQLDLIPADYFRMKSRGPKKTSALATKNSLKFENKIAKQKNLSNYNDQRKGMADLFSTSKFTQIQKSLQKQLINDSDKKVVTEKLFDSIGTSGMFTNEEDKESSYRPKVNTKTKFLEEVYVLDDVYQAHLVSQMKLVGVGSNVTKGNVDEKTKDFNSFLLKMILTTNRNDILQSEEQVFLAFYIENLIQLIKRNALRSLYKIDKEDVVINAFKQFYFARGSSNTVSTKDEVRIIIDTLILLLHLCHFSLDSTEIAKDLSINEKKIRSLLTHIGCKYDSGTTYTLTAPVQLPTENFTAKRGGAPKRH